MPRAKSAPNAAMPLCFRFNQFELLPATRQLLMGARPVLLGARAFDLLLCLIERRGRVVDKDELLASVWPGRVVGQNNLNVQVSGLRKLLGPQALVTVTGYGYRFGLEVKAVAPGREPLAVSARSRVALPGKPSVVVLPFLNFGDDPQLAWFADGVTEDITTELARFPGLFVIARTSAFTYKGQAVDVRSVSRELGVRYVVEGSVRRAGPRVRVVVQLIDALTGGHVWAERYDRVHGNIFDLQEELTRVIVSAMASHINAA